MLNITDPQQISTSQGVIPGLLELEQLKQLKTKKYLGKGGNYHQTELLLQSIKLAQKD